MQFVIEYYYTAILRLLVYEMQDHWQIYIM